MAATNSADQFRLDLENVLAHLVQADEHLRVAQMKHAQWARTDYEASVLQEMIAARSEVKLAHAELLEFHRNKRTHG